MKKDRVIIIILSIIFIICFVGLMVMLSFGKDDTSLVEEEKSFKLTCNKDNIKKDKNVTCILKGDIKDYEVSAVSASIEESSDFELVKVNTLSSWEGDGENGDIDLYTDENKKGKFDMVEFEISLKNNKVDEIEISITNNSYFDQDFNEHKLGDITKKLVVEK